MGYIFAHIVLTALFSVLNLRKPDVIRSVAKRIGVPYC